MKRSIIALSTLLILGTFFVGNTPKEVNVEVVINEWKVPWENSRPRDPYVAPDGNIWFVGQRTHYVAEFDPETQEFRKIDLENGAGPHTVVVNAQGSPWYTGNTANHLGEVNPKTGEITKYMMPEDMSARDPHTIAINKNGDFWFANQGANSIAFFDMNSKEEIIIPVPTQRSRPYGIVMDVDMVTPWVVLFGSHKLATVDPDSKELTEIDLPNEASRPRRLEQTSDGMIWYGDYSRGYIGSYNPGTAEFDEWKLPSGEKSRPYAVTVDDKDRVWLVETGVSPNMFVGFDTNLKEFVSSTEIPSGGGSVRHMVFEPKTNSIWFGTDTNYLGQARLDQ